MLLFTALADGFVQVLMAIGVPPALRVPAQPCPSDATARLVSSSLQPCLAQPWAPQSWTHISAHPWPIPIPRGAQCLDLIVPWCPPTALLLAGAVGQALTDGPCCLSTPRGATGFCCCLTQIVFPIVSFGDLLFL